MNNDKTNEYLPDLPGLESVKSRDFQTVPFLIYVGGFAIWQIGILVWGYLKYKNFIDEAFLIPFYLIVALGVYVFLRVITSFFAYETDSKGFIMSGLLRTTRLFRKDIESASYRKKFYGTKILTLTTNNGTFKIDPRGIGSSVVSGDLTVASIWQHLRRLGKANSIELPQSVMSLWEDVSDSVPVEIEWGKSPTRKTKIWSAIAAGSFPVFGLSALFLFNGKLIMLLLCLLLSIVFILMGLLLFAPSALHTAYKVGVKREGLEIELAFKSLFLPWSEIVTASWHYNQQTSMLSINSLNPKAEVKINYSPGNKESQNLVLAIIRQLRASNASIAIPLPSIMTTSDGKLKSCSKEPSASLRRAYLATLPKSISKKFQWLYVLPSFALIAGMAGLFGMLFLEPVGSLSRTVYSGADTLYFFPGLCWPLFISFFACVFLLGFAGERLALYLAGEHRSEFAEYISLGSGRNFNHIFVRGLIVIAILGITATPLYVGYYMKITDKSIAVNRLFELHERHYDWSTISSVEVRKKAVVGESCSAGTYYINFSDGSYWKLDKGDYVRISNEQIRAAVDYVVKKADTPIKTVWKE